MALKSCEHRTQCRDRASWIFPCAHSIEICR